ncbi:hypothetical protein JOF56_000923 [Kibdelosporangium banguiense]|uniref:Uncharacterized protein n=1 Tax=Kibdelosporangium banguiense TaxID=1365924 RepID=A0ABS4T7Y3_9PSEU|nr:hypothetical protein [Kibdelosporangium banguiense]MBP2320538.1 hypothetical protein [Kibdelosporangium banguiense]
MTAMQNLKRAAVIAAIIGAGVTLPVVQANASTTGSRSCSASGYVANFWLEYHASGSYDYPDKFHWELLAGGSRLGNRSNVNAKIRSVNSGGTGDPVHYEWPSQDNIGPGRDSHTIPNSVKVARSKSMYASYQFIFDRPNDSDPRCTGRTPSV